ncbi:MAG: TonB-dependent receptor [Bacteroidetes bacterium]|nr:TonB-dependent receptor [Bacteroidota bacterium]HET6243020.1 hypothetical protein [Bacteroidia bacterium]
MPKFFLLFSAIVFVTGSFAQVKDKDLGNEQVEILGDFNPVISDAFKIGKNPVINDTTARLPIPDYKLLNKKVNTSFEVDPIPAAKMKGEPLSNLYRTHIKGGFGNYFTPLGEIYFNSLRSKEFSYLAFLKHISSTGSISNAYYSGFSNTGTGLAGSYFKPTHTISGDFNYNRNVLHYYAIPNGIPYSPIYDFPGKEITKDLIRQRFNLFSIGTEAQSTYKDSTKLHHNVKLRYNNFADLYDTAIENNVRLDVKLGKYHGRELIGLNIGTDYYHNTLPTDTTDNAIINLGPNIVSSGKKWRVKVGAGLFAGVGTDQIGSFHFYPDVDFNFNLIENIIIPYGGINGKLERNSYRSLTSINPFMTAYTPLKNTNTRYNIFGGLRGSLSSTITFNAGVSYSDVHNMAFFINDYNVYFPERFSVVYDDVKLLNITGELAYQKTEKLKILLKGDWYRYQMTNELHPWHRPDAEITLTTLYSLRDKIIVKADAFYLNTRYGTRRYEVSDNLEVIPGKYPEKLKGFADINLGVEYRYTKQLSAFVNFNNIGAAKYNRWYNYPLQRFNLMGGFTYSF